MNWRRPTWWFLHRVKGRFSQEAGAALFQGLRNRLTLWYCGVLGAALVLFSVALYFGTQYFLLNPIENDTAGHARAHASQWASGQVDHTCPLFSSQGQFGQPSDAASSMPE